MRRRSPPLPTKRKLPPGQGCAANTLHQHACPKRHLKNFQIQAQVFQNTPVKLKGSMRIFSSSWQSPACTETPPPTHPPGSTLMTIFQGKPEFWGFRLCRLLLDQYIQPVLRLFLSVFNGSFDRHCHVSLHPLSDIMYFLQSAHEVRLRVFQGSACLETGFLSLFGPLSLSCRVLYETFNQFHGFLLEPVLLLGRYTDFKSLALCSLALRSASSTARIRFSSSSISRCFLAFSSSRAFFLCSSSSSLRLPDSASASGTSASATSLSSASRSFASLAFSSSPEGVPYSDLGTYLKFATIWSMSRKKFGL